MKYTRREFVKFGGFAAATVLGFSYSAFPETTKNILETQTSGSFRELINSEFYLWNKSISTPAKLVEVTDFPNRTAKGECYSMVFEIPTDYAEQATYNVFHPALGNFELFLTEGKNQQGFILIATINRI